MINNRGFTLTHKFHQMCVRFISPLKRQQSWYVSILVNACASTGCGCVAFLLRLSSGDPEPSAADTQGFYFCSMTEHNTAIQHSADRAGQEVRHRYNIKTSNKFQNKLSVIMCRARPAGTDERFSESMVALNSVITAKSHSLMTPAVWLWNAASRRWRTAEHGEITQQSRSGTYMHPVESQSWELRGHQIAQTRLMSMCVIASELPYF